MASHPLPEILLAAEALAWPQGRELVERALLRDRCQTYWRTHEGMVRFTLYEMLEIHNH